MIIQNNIQIWLKNEKYILITITTAMKAIKNK